MIDTEPVPPDTSLRVLIVENHDDTRLTLSQLLSQLGHRTRSTASMHEALDALQQAEPDVLLCDIGLPDGDGWQLLEQAQPSGRIYAIAMSGYGRKSDRERSAAAGFRRHLVKPIDIDELEALLADALRQRQEGERGA